MKRKLIAVVCGWSLVAWCLAAGYAPLSSRLVIADDVDGDDEVGVAAVFVATADLPEGPVRDRAAAAEGLAGAGDASAADSALATDASAAPEARLASRPDRSTGPVAAADIEPTASRGDSAASGDAEAEGAAEPGRVSALTSLKTADGQYYSDELLGPSSSAPVGMFNRPEYRVALRPSDDEVQPVQYRAPTEGTAHAADAAHPESSAPVYRVAQRPAGSPHFADSHPAGGAPAYRMAEQPPAQSVKLTPADPLRNAAEHPLTPAIRWAEAGLDRMRTITDYTCTFYKRERIGGTLNDYEVMYLKVRHEPFSVYIYFLSPPSMRGQEVIYIAGANDGHMWAHPTGVRNRLIGTVSLDPTGMIAMKGNRYPLTDIGFLNLTERLVIVGRNDAQFGECDVQFFQGAKIGGRTCTCVQVVHPVPRRNFTFHLARIFVDDELNLPVRYEAYSWPRQEGGQPELEEEYTYLNLQTNVGLSDFDFDTRNPNYGFR